MYIMSNLERWTSTNFCPFSTTLCPQKFGVESAKLKSAIF
jgi:hypothetical protein